MSNLTINNPANPYNASQSSDANTTGDASAQWTAIVAAQKDASNGREPGQLAATNNGSQSNVGATSNGARPGEAANPGQNGDQKPTVGSNLSLWAHGVLTAGSFLPSVFGSAFSAADGTLYHVEGDDTSATISFGAAGVGLFTDAAVAKAAALGLSAAAKALKAGAAVKAGAVAVKVSAIVLAVGKDVSLTSKIGESTYATKLAEKLSDAAQRDVDNLLSQLKARNGNPGIGTRPLGNGFFELRARNGGRAIVKRTGDSSFDVVGKFQGHVRGDDANSAIIKKLIDDYKP